MAVTAYTGRPGSGKSYGMIEQVILPAVAAGRRVLTNIEGVKPDQIVAHCIVEGADPDKVGSVVIFDGQQALEPFFFPTEQISDDKTFVKGGDLLVFDEWRLYFPNSGKIPSAQLEPFLRWHRHLTGPDGQSCDVVIGTQLITDVHRNFRGLVHRSYKFRKLDAVGASKAYAWHVYEGHLQPKGGHYAIGNGRYRPEIFALYKSYAGPSQGKETSTDARSALINKWTISGAILALCLFGASGMYLWFVTGEMAVPSPHTSDLPPVTSTIAGGSTAREYETARAGRGNWRLLGTVWGDSGIRIAVMSASGAIRYLPPDGWRFDVYGRAVSGRVDGQLVVAEDFFEAVKPASALPNFMGAKP